MNPLTEAREEIAAALQTAIPNLTVYPATPEAVTCPAVVLRPGDPWAEALTWKKTQVRLVATLMSVQGSNESAASRLKQMVWDTLGAVRGLGGIPGDVSQPQQQQYGATQVLALDIPITVHVED